MLREIRYRGALVSDTSIPGERKADGILPAHGNGAVPLSRSRWLVCFATLDPSGWDAVRSIVYQIREGAPDGPVVKEGLLAPYVSGWDPLGQEVSLRKIHGMPMAFGVPKGAVRDGRLMPNQNVFAVKWYRHALLEKEGRLLNSHTHRDLWPEGAGVKQHVLRVEWMQFRLNDAEDDIEVLQPPRALCQKGYEEGAAFCSLGPGRFMNHAMTPPVPEDASCTVWVECDTFGADPERPHQTHGQIAPVAYTWNAQTGLYEWTRTGPLTWVPGKVIGETSISRFGDAWVVAARSFSRETPTVWFRSEDLFEGLGDPIERPGRGGPRHSYRCPDGRLRIFINDGGRSPYRGMRNPLYVFEVDPETFEYSEPRMVVDLIAEGLPFEKAFADMSKLCPNQGNRQVLVFRAIDRQMTADPQPGEAELSPEAFPAAGIHYAELVYEEDVPDPWVFQGTLAQETMGK